MEAESKSCRLSKLRQNASGVSIEKWAKFISGIKGDCAQGTPTPTKSWVYPSDHLPKNRGCPIVTSLKKLVCTPGVDGVQGFQGWQTMHTIKSGSGLLGGVFLEK